MTSLNCRSCLPKGPQEASPHLHPPPLGKLRQGKGRGQPRVPLYPAVRPPSPRVPTQAWQSLCIPSRPRLPVLGSIRTRAERSMCLQARLICLGGEGGLQPPHPSGHPAELSPPGHQPGRERWGKLQGRNPAASGEWNGAAESWVRAAPGAGGAQLRPRKRTRRPGAAALTGAWPSGLVACCQWERGPRLPPGGWGAVPHSQ